MQAKPSIEVEANDADTEMPESSSADGNRHETSAEASCLTQGSESQDATMSDAEVQHQVESVKRMFVERTENYGVPQLERLYTRVVKGIFETKNEGDGSDLKPSILKFLLKFAENEANF